ncbi:hypothetical protein WJ97_11930 [Burkholderia ubonensis]|uniref:RCC1 domain-containing protein n=1 Tax=Burkholderia ubonensis TaxID=101571 RepID=UPI00075632BB|nr:putative Ig domain-containing protein [Burkholderia ubonensis]KVP96587.1 hypothetical protein WJ97_11930 [Burkholderia ubonensis]
MNSRIKQFAIAACLSMAALSAAATEFLVVVPVKGKRGPGPDIQVTLSAATLPAAKVGSAYSYDLKPHLLVTGDSSLDLTKSTWAATSASQLPAGLSLDASGLISGKPNTMNEAGASFEVVSTYKNKTGRQVYVIRVDGVALEVLQLSAGDDHTCAVTHAGGVKCWGLDDLGQLGNDAALLSKSTPVDVLGLTSGVASVSAGGQHTCAVTTAGAVRCWGRGSYGQLGNGATANSPTPVAVQGLTSGVAMVSTGWAHTCAVTTAGGAKCWGRDNYGQLGDSVNLANQSVPVDVLGLTAGVTNVATGYNHTCAVTTAGGVKCWGQNDVGQLGINSYTNKPTPADVVGLSSAVKSVDAGYVHTCAVTTAGGVKCWGDDAVGQLGNGLPLAESLVPVDVTGLTSGVVSVAAGDSHNCALTAGGRVKCWGSNDMSQLGNPAAPVVQPDPLDVGLQGVSAVTAGWGHTCVTMGTRAAKCWGHNSDGQLGINSTETSPTPVNVLPQ